MSFDNGPHVVANLCEEFRQYHLTARCADPRCLRCYGEEARSCTVDGCTVKHSTKE